MTETLASMIADPASPSADPALGAERSQRILVYCTKGPGARSLLAAQTLKGMGYEGVEVLGVRGVEGARRRPDGLAGGRASGRGRPRSGELTEQSH